MTKFQVTFALLSETFAEHVLQIAIALSSSATLKNVQTGEDMFGSSLCSVGATLPRVAQQFGVISATTARCVESMKAILALYYRLYLSAINCIIGAIKNGQNFPLSADNLSVR